MTRRGGVFVSGAQISDCHLDNAEAFSEGGGKLGTFGGERKPAPFAVDQGVAKVIFKASDLLRNSGVRDVQRTGGGGKALQPRRSFKRT